MYVNAFENISMFRYVKLNRNGTQTSPLIYKWIWINRCMCILFRDFRPLCGNMLSEEKYVQLLIQIGHSLTGNNRQ